MPGPLSLTIAYCGQTPAESAEVRDLATRLVEIDAVLEQLRQMKEDTIHIRVGDLVWLEFVTFASEWWVWNGTTWERKESQNTAAPNEEIVDLTPLAGLTALQTLTVRDTQAADHGADDSRLSSVMPRGFRR